MRARILDGTKNVYDAECDDGLVRSCVIKGKVLKSEGRYYNPIAPGDVVNLDDGTLEEGKAQILSVEPRRNEFVRWNIKRRAPQLLAANLDYLILVTTPDEPPFRPRFIDRALAQAEREKIEPVIVCNKYDLGAAKDGLFVDMVEAWEKVGYQLLRVSAKTGEGMVELAGLLKDRTSAFVGQSGVGKSSLINVLDNSVVLKTGSLSQKYGRGTHTTTKGSLMHIQLSEGLTGGVKGVGADIIDTPGVRRFLLHDVSCDDIAFYFREFRPFLGKCGYGMSCSHLSEDGCAIKQAVRDGSISPLRYESWLRIYSEQKSGRFED